MKSNLETQKIEAVKLAHSFEIEELEERVEFGKWSAKAEGGYTCGGGDCDGKMKYEATYTMRL
jgi:hypothetical protein